MLCCAGFEWSRVESRLKLCSSVCCRRFTCSGWFQNTPVDMRRAVTGTHVHRYVSYESNIPYHAIPYHTIHRAERCLPIPNICVFSYLRRFLHFAYTWYITRSTAESGRHPRHPPRPSASAPRCFNDLIRQTLWPQRASRRTHSCS